MQSFWSWLALRARQGLSNSAYKSRGAYNEYYETAYYDDLRWLWRGTEYVKKDLSLSSMAYYRALHSYFDSNYVAIRDRRRLLFSYLLPQYSNDGSIDGLRSQSMLIKRYSDLPIFNIIKRALNLLCVLYDLDPIRTFFKEDTKNKIMLDIYENSGLNAIYSDIYERLTYTGLQLFRIVFKKDEKTGKVIPIIRLMYPDSFRYKANNFEILELTYIDYDADGELIYRVWTPEKEEIRKPLKDTVINNSINLGKFEVIAENENIYGFVPFLVLNFSGKQQQYPGGMFELLEGQLDNNSSRFQATTDQNYNAIPTKYYKNFKPEEIPTAVDEAIVKDGVINTVEGQPAEPSIEMIAADTVFAEIEEFADERKVMILSNEGIPSSKINNETATSGIEKAISEDELTKKRRDDISIMKKIELEIAEYIVKISDIDNATSLNELDDFAIEYQISPLLQTESEIYEFDKIKVNNLDMDIIKFKEKHAGYKVAIKEEEAIKINEARAESLAKFKIVPEPIEKDGEKEAGKEAEKDGETIPNEADLIDDKNETTEKAEEIA